MIQITVSWLHPTFIREDGLQISHLMCSFKFIFYIIVLQFVFVKKKSVTRSDLNLKKKGFGDKSQPG